jgi:flagellar protein FlaG
MKVQSVDSGSIYLQPELQARVFPERQQTAAKKDVESRLPGQVESEAGKTPSPQILGKAVEQANRTLETYGTELRFSIHEDSGEVMVKVINTRDDSVIREIPPELVLDFVASVKKMLGIIIDKLI